MEWLCTPQCSASQELHAQCRAAKSTTDTPIRGTTCTVPNKLSDVPQHVQLQYVYYTKLCVSRLTNKGGLFCKADFAVTHKTDSWQCSLHKQGQHWTYACGTSTVHIFCVSTACSLAASACPAIQTTVAVKKRLSLCINEPGNAEVLFSKITQASV